MCDRAPRACALPLPVEQSKPLDLRCLAALGGDVGAVRVALLPGRDPHTDEGEFRLRSLASVEAAQQLLPEPTPRGGKTAALQCNLTELHREPDLPDELVLCDAEVPPGPSRCLRL